MLWEQVVKIKSTNEIFNTMKTYYQKIQDKVTDLTSGSVAGSILWSVSSQLEEVYTEIEEVKKQSYIVSAEDTYLDRLISGTFGLDRNRETRATGYVILNSDSPLQNPEELRLWCADYDPSTDTLSGDDTALKFITSGSDKQAGRVFVLIAPKNSTVSIENGNKYIDMSGKYAQFIVVPVVSLTKGETANVPEGAIRIISSSVPGISGVINTYSPISNFFSTPSETPIQDRVTSLLSIDNFTLNVVNAYNFSGSGLVGFETYDGKTLKGLYQGRLENGGNAIVSELLVDVHIPYTDSYTKSVVMDSSSFSASVHTFKRLDESGRSLIYTLSDSWFGNRNTNIPPQNNVITLLKNNLVNSSLIVRQVESDIDKSIIYDPDNVIDEQGVLIDSARIGGGTDIESDAEYRIKLRKYLDSLARSTPTALEAGALTVPGITFALTLPNYMSPRGTSTLLVSGGDSGTVNSFQVYQLKTTLEQYWKAAGVRLIIKTPQKVEVTAMCRVELLNGYTEVNVEPNVRYAIIDYFARKLPGSTISYSELSSVILSVPGVKDVWNVYIGKKLSDYSFRISEQTEGVKTTRNNQNLYSGIKFSTVYTMFKSDIEKNDLVIISKQSEDVLKLDDSQYKLYSVMSDNRFVEDKDMSWNSKSSVANAYVLRGIDNVQDYEKFLGDYVYKKITSYPMYEITRHLTESLNSDDFLDLPISFEDLSMSLMKPYTLGIVEVPVLGTFRTDKEILPLIGIQFTK